MLSQFATKLGGFSSQYGSSNSVAYVVSNVLRKPHNYPAYGDFTEACVMRTYDKWWKIAPGVPAPLVNQSDKYFVSDDFIELIYDQKVYITNVNIYETYNPGAVVRILALDQSVQHEGSKWFTMWEMEGGKPQRAEKESRIFTPYLRRPPFPTQVIRLEFRHDNLEYYTELDAVELVGDTSVDVDGLQSDVTKRMGGLSLKSGERTNIPDSTSQGNGHFDLLPGEITLYLLANLTLEDLSRMACVSRLLREYCYSPVLPQHQHLNLQPYWFIQNTDSIKGFVKKCTKMQSLNLSWCGTHSDMLNSSSIIGLVGIPTLTRLELSCCPLTDDAFTQIARRCINLQHLDVSSTYEYLSVKSLQMISFLTELRWLNLFTTAVDDHCVFAIARTCSKLQYLNLGSCQKISNYDEVVGELSRNCADLRGLDLWRAKTLNNEGILYMVNNLKNLTSLDIGWCFRVHASQMGNDALPMLIEKSPHLKKIFFTANRHITDNELKLLAKHCPQLEQLDLLGNNSISSSGVRQILQHCKNMKFCDVSFCGRITVEIHQELARDFPKCAVKRSYS